MRNLRKEADAVSQGMWYKVQYIGSHGESWLANFVFQRVLECFIYASDIGAQNYNCPRDSQEQ